VIELPLLVGPLALMTAIMLHHAAAALVLIVGPFVLMGALMCVWLLEW
jgi:hypothetical protein